MRASIVVTTAVLVLLAAAAGSSALRVTEKDSSDSHKIVDPLEWVAAAKNAVAKRDPAKLQRVLQNPLVRDAPTTVSDHEMPKPSTGCDVCRMVVGTIADILATKSNTTRGALKLAVGTVCVEATRTAIGSAICLDISDLVLDELHKASRYALTSVHFNISMIACSDVLPVCTVPCCTTHAAPEQIHIGFPTDGDAVTQGQMQATWATYDKPQHPQLIFWPTANHSAAIAVPAVTTTYTVSGWKGWLHGAVMTGLLPNTEYSYQVGDNSYLRRGNVAHWSAVLNFTTFPSNIGTPERPLRVASIADMGTGGTHTETVDAMWQMIQEGKVDMIVHGGDISYADGDSYRWDRFLRQMQPLVSRVPYMCIPGNHELLFNFSAYRTRFWMQPRANYGAPNDAMFYTFSVGPHIRFLMMDSESPINTPEINSVQTSWADRVLKDASAAKQFVFAAFHRPMYCTSTAGESCFDEQVYIQNQVEDMFIANNVALVHTGHVHNYERTFPVAHGVRQSTSYENATYPISFVNGGPGCEEGLQPFGDYHGKPRPNWFAVRNDKTSFQFHEIFSQPNAEGTKVKHTDHMKQFFSKDLSVMDKITLTKNL